MMTVPLRWYRKTTQPGLVDLRINYIELEILLSKEPFVQTQYALDVDNFDFSARNYRLEAMLSWVFFLLSVIASVALLTHKEGRFTSLTEQQQVELTKLREGDAPFNLIDQRRQELRRRKMLSDKRDEAIRRTMRDKTWIFKHMNKRAAQRQNRRAERDLVDTRDGHGVHQQLNHSSFDTSHSGTIHTSQGLMTQ